MRVIYLLFSIKEGGGACRPALRRAFDNIIGVDYHLLLLMRWGQNKHRGWRVANTRKLLRDLFT